MQLTDEQKTKVSEWIANGLRLSEIQERLGAECGVRLTYMEARMLVDDLKLLPLDPVEPASAKPVPETALEGEEDSGSGESTQGGPAQVSVTSDTLARPGAIASGKVNFSDGQQVVWLLDQMGQMRMLPPHPGYMPPKEDMAKVNQLMELEFQRLGF
ncbi:MAG: hypothetical protein EBS01_10440 [Verrucomicrobia bacterium]|nr:hypothetical protein [Verrucomicrobiota bacterium]